MKLARFTADVVVEVDDDQTPDEALDSWLADNDVSGRFELDEEWEEENV